MIKFTFDQDSDIHKVFIKYAELLDLRVSQVYRKITSEAVKNLQKEIDDKSK